MPRAAWVIALLAGVAFIRFPAIGTHNEVSYRTVALVLMLLSAVLTLGVFIFLNINRWTGILIVWAPISAIVASLALSSGTQLYTKYSFEAIAVLCAGSILYSAMVLSIDNVEVIKDAMILFCIIHIAYAWSQRQAFGVYGSCGLMATTNDASAFLAVCAPACFRKRRWPFLLAWPLGFYAIPACIGVIGTFVALVVWLCLAGNRLIVFGACAGCIVMFVVYSTFVDAPSTSRFEMWAMAYRDVIDNRTSTGMSTWPIGFGVGNWILYYTTQFNAGRYTTDFVRLHNTFLESFAEMGIVWVAAVAGYLTDIARRITAKNRSEICGLVACIVVNCSNSTFKLNMACGVFILTWLAMVEIALRKNKGIALCPGPLLKLSPRFVI